MHWKLWEHANMVTILNLFMVHWSTIIDRRNIILCITGKFTHLDNSLYVLYK